MRLTTEEARILANTFLSSAKVVNDYLDANHQKISRAEYESLYESFKTLLRASTSATTTAVGLVIDALKEPATELKNVIDQATENIHRFRDIGQVLGLAAGLAGLAAGIMAKDPEAIMDAITKLCALTDKAPTT